MPVCFMIMPYGRKPCVYRKLKPGVVVGLVLYLALSRSGPLGSLALPFTPTAMVIAQAILAIPIITALVHRASERAWARYRDELTSDGATRLQAVPQIPMTIRAELVTAVLAGFGRQFQKSARSFLSVATFAA